MLLNYHQEHPADHVELEDVLKALDISAQSVEPPEGAAAKVDASDDAGVKE